MKCTCLQALLLLVLGSLGFPAAAYAQADNDFHLDEAAGDQSQAGSDFQPVEATIADIQAAYRARTLTTKALVRMYLNRIAKFDQSVDPQPLAGGVGNQPLNSFMH